MTGEQRRRLHKGLYESKMVEMIKAISLNIKAFAELLRKISSMFKKFICNQIYVSVNFNW